MTEGVVNLIPWWLKLQLPFQMVPLLEQVNTVLVRYAVIDLALLKNIPVSKPPEIVWFQLTGQQHTFTVLSQGHIVYPALCHNLLHRELGNLSLPYVIMVDHCIAVVMLIGPVSTK